jgi:hypothetical protein
MQRDPVIPRNLGRLMRAWAIAGQGWGREGDLLSKAAVGNIENIGANSVANLGELDIMRATLPLSLLGRMTGMHRVGFDSGGLYMTDRPAASWVEESLGVPVAKITLSRLAILGARKVCSLHVLSSEAASEDGAEERFGGELTQALAEAVDVALMDGVAGSASRPASVAYNATSVASSGDVLVDAAALLDAFAGDLREAVFITNPKTAADASVQIANPSAQNNIGARGGVLLGLPCLTSQGVPIDESSSDSDRSSTLTLLDPSGMQLALGAATVNLSTAALLEMDDAPTGDTETPATATSAYVSLFQSDSVGILATLGINWRMVRAASCAVATGALYRS